MTCAELAGDMLRPALLSLIGAARDGALRIVAAEEARRRKVIDAEAVHDFRVALRRLRTHLGVARLVWGGRLGRIRDELRFYARETGVLRDEEVLVETLSGLDLPESVRAAAFAWVVRRSREAERRRRAAVRVLRGGPSEPVPAGKRGKSVRPLDRSLARLADRLVSGQARPIPARELGHAAIGEAARLALGLVDADVADAAAMHELRIRFKRLRYTAELFAEVVGEASELSRLCAKMQRRLGDLHDLDEAKARVGRARSLDAFMRDAALLSLRRAREAMASKARVELVRVRPTLVAQSVVA
jgi:CHAD domain-containing protein